MEADIDTSDTDQAQAAETNGKPQKDDIDRLIDAIQEEEQNLELMVVPFKLKDKTGNVLLCKIQELDGPGRGVYINFQAQKGKYGNEGKVTGFRSLQDLEIKLVSMTLYGPDGKLLNEAFINTFPGRLIKKIHDIAARISGLDAKAEVRAKNS